MSNPPLFPGHPKVPLLLDTLIRHQEGDPLPNTPSPELLDSFVQGLGSCKRNADRRADSAREGIRLGNDALVKARRRLERQKAGVLPRSEEELKRSKVRDTFTGRREIGATNAEIQDSRRPLAEEGRTNSAQKSLYSVGRKSPVQNGAEIRVKREISASPVPSETSVHGNPSSPYDPTRSSTAVLNKKKKRKIAHETGSAAPALQNATSFISSTSASPLAHATHLQLDSSRGSDAVGRRPEESVGDATIPNRPPITPNSMASSSAPKIKLKINPNKAALATQMSSANSDLLQPIIHPNVVFALSLPNSSSSANNFANLIPTRQPIPIPAPPQPKRQKDVNQDFSVVKNVAQTVQWSTFWTGIETYIRDVGEEDIAMLTFRPDDRDVFDMVPLGRHYQDIWDEEDASLPFSQSSPQTTNQSWSSSAGITHGYGQREKERDQLGNRIGKGLRRAYPKDLSVMDLKDERKGPGMLEERVVAALCPSALILQSNASINPLPKGMESIAIKLETHSDHQNGSIKENDRIASSSSSWPIPSQRIGSGDDGYVRPRTETIDATIGETEEGVKRELRHLGLLDVNEEVDWTKKEDDEIAMVLRQAQRSLRDQIAHNNVRKDRLTELVRDRLAYTGYKKTLEGMEKVIENAWLKRSTRKPKKSKSKDKEELAQSKRIGDKSLLPEAVKLAIDARRRWIDIVGGAMATPEVGTRYTGLPVESVYHGLDALKADVAHRRWSTPTE